MKALALLVALAVTPILAQNQQQPILSPSWGLSEQPPIGFGTWRLTNSEDNTTESVSFAIQAGYRQVDCAAVYGNEVAVGKGIADGLKKAGVKRTDIWVTSKLWNDKHGDPETVEEALDKTLADLGVEYLDLYLMHWPVGSEGGKNKLSFVSTWESMTTLPRDKVRHIGISNFSPDQLDAIIEHTGVTPYAHQMELHPYLQQREWIAEHDSRGIRVTAYSPLGNMNPTYGDGGKTVPPLIKNDLFVKIGEKRNCTAAQVALKWGARRGTSVIPKSSHEEYIVQNLGASECELTKRDVEEIESLMEVKRFSNPSKGWGVKLFEGLEDA